MLQINIPEIKQIEAIAQSSDEYVSLSQGALKIGGIPQDIKDHIQTLLKTDSTDYYQSAWGILPLREKLASTFSNKHNCNLSHKNIVITHGCMGAISTIFLSILEKDDEVIAPNPTYPAYKNVIALARAKTVYVDMPQQEDWNYWHIDIEKIKNATTPKTKIIVFSHPCNPLGTMVSKENLIEIKNWCEEKKIFLIVDESYDDFIFDGNFFSSTSLVPQSEWVIRTGSYSKSLSMSGWRIGFMVVPEKFSVTAGITQDAILNCPNVIAQYAVLYALDHPELIQPFHKQIEKNRNFAYNMLQPLAKKGILSFQKPPSSFYLFLKTQKSDSFDMCMNILHTAKVGLIPGKAFGPAGAPFLRLCYARKPEVLEEGLKRILHYFE